MWSKLDDNVLHHDKTETAARRLGPRGLVLALGTVTFGLVYCNWKLTDGFIHNDALDRYGVDPELRALMVDVGFWHPDADGYRIHDFHEFNPTARAVKAKRLKDRLRKQSRAGFRVDSARNPDGFPRASTSRAIRTDPIRTDPSTSPTPSPAKGLPTPRAARQAALRAQGPPPASWRERCGHQPTCSTPEACRLKVDRGIA